MNLDDLKKHISTATPFEWCAKQIHLRKLSAQDGLILFNRIKKETDEPHTPEVDREKTLAFNADVASKTLADEAGDLLCDSDDGRALLKQMSFGELAELSEIALRHSGYGGDEKKANAAGVLCVSPVPGAGLLASQTPAAIPDDRRILGLATIRSARAVGRYSS